MLRIILMVLVCIALTGAVIFVTLASAVRSTTFGLAVGGVKDWDSLCEVEDCSQFPPLHMTYDVDGTHYYFPASTNLPDLTINYGPSFFGVLPIGHKRDESRYRRSIRVGRTCCTGWGPLDFDLYLETRDDHTISRGFGRIGRHTDTMRFGRGVLATLPSYYEIDIAHPSGDLRDFSFYLHSRDRRSDDFLLNSHLRSLRQHSLNLAQRAEPFAAISSASDLPNAGFASFNDAFWIVADRREEPDSGPFLRGLAVVSKAPMLHGRHVYGHCNYNCRFYSLWFSDAPFNAEPLLMVEMQGDDIDVMLRHSCAANSGDPTCAPERVNFSNIRLRFDMVEQVIESLRTRPAIPTE